MRMPLTAPEKLTTARQSLRRADNDCSRHTLRRAGAPVAEQRECRGSSTEAHFMPASFFIFYEFRTRVMPGGLEGVRRYFRARTPL
jgi:hypothetical protein